MRNVVWLVLLFVVAVVAATTLGRNDGLVTLYWSGWRLDVSLNLAVLALVASCIVIFLAAQALHSLLSLPTRAREWRALQRERAAQALLREGLAEFHAGRYSRAHKAVQRALLIHERSPEPATDRDQTALLHLMSAASLHRLQDRRGRDEQMAKAMQAQRGSRSVVGDGAQLMAAEWAVDDRDADRAMAVLSDLPPGVGRRTQALRLRLQAQRMARKPMDALRTARLLAKHQGFSKDAARGLLRSLASEAIDDTHDVDQLQRTWGLLEAADRLDPVVASRAARRAARFGAHEQGRAWLKPLWESMPQATPADRETIALAMLSLSKGIGSDWLPRLESAFQVYPQDAAVAAAAGTAFAECRLWGKARRPLEQAAASTSLDPRARRQAWRLLAELAREEGDEDRASRCEQAAGAVEG